MPEPEKPLFIPLKSEFYDQFEAGTKNWEYRKYGPRWNERVCRIGRTATLSKGYGKQNRLHGKVVGFIKCHGTELAEPSQSAALKVFGTLDVDIACIGIKLLPLTEKE